MRVLFLLICIALYSGCSKPVPAELSPDAIFSEMSALPKTGNAAPDLSTELNTLRVMISEGNLDTAELRLAELGRMNPSSADVHLHLLRIALKRQNRAHALGYLKLALERSTGVADQLDTYADFQALRAMPEYPRIMKKYVRGWGTIAYTLCGGWGQDTFQLSLRRDGTFMFTEHINYWGIASGSWRYDPDRSAIVLEGTHTPDDTSGEAQVRPLDFTLAITYDPSQQALIVATRTGEKVLQRQDLIGSLQDSAR